MPTIIVTTHFGKRDTAQERLHKAHAVLTIENTVTIPRGNIGHVLDVLWELTAENVIDSFTVKAE